MSDPTTALDAERALVSCALSGYADLDRLDVQPSDLHHPLHEQIWAAALRIQRAGNSVTPVSVRLALDGTGTRYDPTLLIDLAAEARSIAEAPYHAGVVLRASGTRRMQRAGTVVAELASRVPETDEELEIAREAARRAVDEATETHARTAARSLADVLPTVIDTAQNGRAAMLSTPWSHLDRIIGGLAPGRLVVVGARPGVGKSVMGTNLALHMAHQHHHAVLVASLEMPEEEVGQRLLAAHARVDLTGLQNGNTDERSWSRIDQCSDELLNMPITIDDSPGQTVTSIRRAARELQRKRDDLALIVVDYLQLLSTPDRGRNQSRAEALGEVSRGLKVLARETGACVVAMAQVNRESVRARDGRPQVSDLRESGSIEADADQVLLLHDSDPDVAEVEVIVGKNRHGSRASVMLQMQGHYARLVQSWHPSNHEESA